MKKIISMALISGVVLMTSGCATMYNSGRVRQNMVKDRIMTTGSQEQKQAVLSGVKPTTALSIIPTSDAKGAYVAMDWMKLSSMPSFMDTFSEAPVSTIGAIIIDAGLVGLATYAIGQATKDGGSGTKNDNNTTGNGNSTVNVEAGDNSPVTVDVHNGDEASSAP